MNFNDFIVWVINSSISETAKAEILAVDFNDPENYVKHVRTLIGVLKSAKVASYVYPSYYKDLEDVYNKLNDPRFIASIPAALAEGKIEPRKAQAAKDVLDILSDPAKLNAAIRERVVLSLPVGSVYELHDDYLGYLLSNDFDINDKKFIENINRINGFLKKSFNQDELEAIGYTGFNFAGDGSRAMRLAVMLEAALSEAQGEIFRSDNLELDQLRNLKLNLEGRIGKGAIKALLPFEEFSEGAVLKMRGSQFPITEGSALRGRLKELDDMLKTSIQYYTTIVNHFRKNIVVALSDFETQDFCLANSKTFKSRKDISYPICYALSQQALPENERTLNLDLVKRGQNYRPTSESPITFVDDRMLTVEQDIESNALLSEYYKSLTKSMQIVFCAVVWDIRSDIDFTFKAVNKPLMEAHDASRDDDEMQQKIQATIQKNVYDKVNRIYVEVVKSLTPEEVQLAFSRAANERPQFIEFMKAMTTLEMLPVYSSHQQEMKTQFIEIMRRSKDDIVSVKLPPEMIELRYAELAARCTNYTSRIIQQREQDAIHAVDNTLSALMRLRIIAQRKPVAFLSSEEEMRASFLKSLKVLYTIIVGAYPAGTKDGAEVLLQFFLKFASKSETKYAELIADKNFIPDLFNKEFHDALFSQRRRDIDELRAKGAVITPAQIAKEEEMNELGGPNESDYIFSGNLMTSLVHLRAAWMWQSSKGEINPADIDAIDAATVFGYLLGVVEDDIDGISKTSASEEEKTSREDELTARINEIRAKRDALRKTEEEARDALRSALEKSRKEAEATLENSPEQDNKEGRKLGLKITLEKDAKDAKKALETRLEMDSKPVWLALAKELQAIHDAHIEKYGTVAEAVAEVVDAPKDDQGPKGKEELDEPAVDIAHGAEAVNAAPITPVDADDFDVVVSSDAAHGAGDLFEIDNLSREFSPPMLGVDELAAKERKEKERKEAAKNPVKNPGVVRCPSDKAVAVQAGGTMVGMREVIGHRRLMQEDALIAFRLNAFGQLDNDLQKDVLAHTVEKMQNKHGLNFIGSTLAGTIAWRKGNTLLTQTVSVGDSLSFLIVLDADNKFVSHKSRLLSTLHNSDNQNEKERVVAALKSNPFYDDERHQHVLPVTRAIGDNNSQTDGLIHDPDIEACRIKLENGERAVIVVASASLAQGVNGRDEEKGLSLDDIGHLIAENHDARADNMAEMLVTAAGSDTLQVAGGERKKYATVENISVAVMEVDSNIPVGAFVFDGFRGDQVSDALADDLYPQLKHGTNLISDLKSACDDYIKHLGHDIYAAIRDEDFELCTQLLYKPEPESRPHFDVGGITHPSPENEAKVARLRQNNESLDLAVKKFMAVWDMKQALYSNRPITERLSDFTRVFKANRALIEQRRDSGAILFLKIITTALFGLGFLVGLWNVKGRQFSSKVAEQLPVDNKTTGHKPK